MLGADDDDDDGDNVYEIKDTQPHAGHGTEAGAECVGKLVSDVGSGRALQSCGGTCDDIGLLML